MDHTLAPYNEYQYSSTVAEDDRREFLIRKKLELEKWLEQIRKELLPMIYKPERGRV